MHPRSRRAATATCLAPTVSPPVPRTARPVHAAGVALVLGAALALAASARSQQPTAGFLDLHLDAGPHAIVPAPDGAGVVVRELEVPAGQGRPASVRPGQPDLPTRTIDVLLPYDADLSSLVLEFHVGPQAGPLSPVISLLGQHYVRPKPIGSFVDPETGQVQPAPPAGVTLDAKGHDLAVYGMPGFFPLLPLAIEDVGRVRKFRIARLRYSPFLWNPTGGSLLKLDSLDVTLRWQPGQVDPEVMQAELADNVLTKWVSKQVVNFDLFADSYLSPFGVTPPTTDYLIVTTEAFRDASGQLEAFRALKHSQGLKTKLVTVETIDKLYTEPERADRIRRYLQERYASLGLRYVLLIGDPDPDDPGSPSDSVGEVPMKMAFALGADAEHDGGRCPTDHYYADLSADWDVDGDGLPGEWEDDVASATYVVVFDTAFILATFLRHGMDFGSEVRVGRIPFADVADADEVLAATIAYQGAALTSALLDLRRRAYVATGNLNDESDTSILGHALESEVMTPAGLDTTTLFEPGSSYTPDISLENEALYDLWRKDPAGLVAWVAHGNATGAFITYDGSDLVRTSDTKLLDDEPRAWVLQGSCSNAEPEVGENLAHALLRDAAVGTFAATRVNSDYADNEVFGDDCTTSDLIYMLSARLVGGLSGGQALADTRHDGSRTYAWEAHNVLTFNLYGDPSGTYGHE